MTSTLDRVLRHRIERHLLGAEKASTAADVARRISGVHVQVASSAQTATALRTTAEPDLDTALWTERSLVRTWAARGTLHLLAADDLPVWVAAMSTSGTAAMMSVICAAVTPWYFSHDPVVSRVRVLGAEPMTREELADAIIAATGHDDLREPLTQGFGAILKPLAFRGLLCSGPPRGRNVTFVAPRAWLGDREPVPADEAIDALAVAHLDAYGPADAGEFRPVVRPEADAGQEVVHTAGPRRDRRVRPTPGRHRTAYVDRRHGAAPARLRPVRGGQPPAARHGQHRAPGGGVPAAGLDLPHARGQRAHRGHLGARPGLRQAGGDPVRHAPREGPRALSVG